jgi:hypothetical protein
VSKTHCPDCGHAWDEHEPGVPTPLCPGEPRKEGDDLCTDKTPPSVTFGISNAASKSNPSTAASDTPRTDKIDAAWCGGRNYQDALHAELYKHSRKLERELLTLRAEVERLRRDKERLAAVSDNKWSVQFNNILWQWTVQTHLQVVGNIGRGDDCRTAIDQAMKGTK